MIIRFVFYYAQQQKQTGHYKRERTDDVFHNTRTNQEYGIFVFQKKFGNNVQGNGARHGYNIIVSAVYDKGNVTGKEIKNQGKFHKNA